MFNLDEQVYRQDLLTIDEVISALLLAFGIIAKREIWIPTAAVINLGVRSLREEYIKENRQLNRMK